MNLFLRIHQDVAGVFALVYVLHVGQLERAVVLEGALPMVEREQIGILVPLDGVVRIADDAAVNEHVPSGDGSEVSHRTDAGGTCGREKQKQLETVWL